MYICRSVTECVSYAYAKQAYDFNEKKMYLIEVNFSRMYQMILKYRSRQCYESKVLYKTEAIWFSIANNSWIPTTILIKKNLIHCAYFDTFRGKIVILVNSKAT